MKRIFLAAAGLLVLAAAAQPAWAGAITVGVADTGDCYPFMCNDSGTSSGQSIEYQQVYTSSAFPGPVTINSLTFYWQLETFGGPGTWLGGTYVFSLSTTSAAVDGLDSTSPSNNLGPDNTQVASVTIPVGGAFFGASHTFNLASNFNYDPTKGNLLLDVTVFNQDDVPNLDSGTNSYTDSDDTGSVMSRAFFVTGFPGAADNNALVTTFGTATAPSIPEPGSLLLLAGTLAGLAALLRRRVQT